MFRATLLFILLFSPYLCADRVSAQSDGTYDPTFVQGTGFAGDVLAITRQADGKLLVGGDQLSIYNGVAVKPIVRLGADGTLDTGFDVGTGPDAPVQEIVTQADGRILVGGNFFNFNGVNSRRLVRLMPNGSVDNSFNIGTGANSMVTSVVVQPDGKVLVGGSFSQWNGATVGGIVRLLVDGSMDPAFNVGAGTNDNVNDVVLRPNGKIVIGGYFTQYNGTTRNQLAQLHGNGTLDTSFNPGAGAGSSYSVIGMALTADGKLICGGDFWTWQGASVNGLVRIATDGARDVSFNGQSTPTRIIKVAIQADGKALLAGTAGLRRVDTDGNADLTFETGTGFYGGLQVVAAIEQLPDGRLLAGGQFSEYNGNAVGSIVRLATSNVGIQEPEQLQASVWPNPSNGRMTIQWPGQEQAWATVRDLTGRIVLEQVPIFSGAGLSLDGAPGVYMLEVRSASGVQRLPIVKQ
ncbi:MAG: T9SS type A sorting domain-containing protein [Flavobacteriales bacterium]|nr:T9SS type A sorting domain-containing protein [Flavobacteriales bacterium]